MKMIIMTVMIYDFVYVDNSLVIINIIMVILDVASISSVK